MSKFGKEGSRWATRHGLNVATLIRAQQAQQQLQQRLPISAPHTSSPNLPLIIRLIASSLRTQVAQAQADGTYRGIGGHLLAMHPDSFLFQRVPPLVVFGEAMETPGSKGRALMRHVTPIQPEMLNKPL